MKITGFIQWLEARWPQWLRWPTKSRQPLVHYEEVEELPDKLKNGLLYVVGEGSHRWYTAMICPCGCGATLHMGLLEDARPRWRAIRQRDGTATLVPSVNRKVGCRAHFFLEHGKIRWCARD